MALALSLASEKAQAADPIRIYAAGSLGTVLPDLIAASGLPAGSVAPLVFGPAGALRQRLQSGEKTDLFASADLAQPQALAGPAVLVVPFARNRMCVASPAKEGLTADNLLDQLLSADVRLATSTPGADPGGDYARAVFARAEALHAVSHPYPRLPRRHQPRSDNPPMDLQNDRASVIGVVSWKRRTSTAYNGRSAHG